MFVIPKKDINNLKTGKKYEFINADFYEYEISWEYSVNLWISKDDIENFWWDAF